MPPTQLYPQYWSVSKRQSPLIVHGSPSSGTEVMPTPPHTSPFVHDCLLSTHTQLQPPSFICAHWLAS
jgi:hypothetical protein